MQYTSVNKVAADFAEVLQITVQLGCNISAVQIDAKSHKHTRETTDITRYNHE